jgi:hypothetical protein
LFAEALSPFNTGAAGNGSHELKDPLLSPDEENSPSVRDLGPFATLLAHVGLWADNCQDVSVLQYHWRLTRRFFVIALLGGCCFALYGIGIRQAVEWKDEYSSTNGPGFVLGSTAAVIILVVAVAQFYMRLLRDLPIAKRLAFRQNAVRDGPGTARHSRLFPAAKELKLKGQFAEVLAISDAAYVQKTGRNAAKIILGLATLCNVVLVTVVLVLRITTQSSDPSLERANKPLFALAVCGIVVGSTLAHVVVGTILLAGLALPVWFLSEELKQRAEKAKSDIETSIDQTPSHIHKRTSLDWVVRERHLMSCLCTSVSARLSYLVIPAVLASSAFILGLLYKSFSRPQLNSGLTIAALVLAVVLVGMLAICSWLSQEGEKLGQAMSEIRSRFPCDGDEDWASQFLALRNDIDSIISHCKNTPLGFSVLGLVITPSLVQTLIYGLFSGVGVIVQNRST